VEQRASRREEAVSTASKWVVATIVLACLISVCVDGVEAMVDAVEEKG